MRLPRTVCSPPRPICSGARCRAAAARRSALFRALAPAPETNQGRRGRHGRHAGASAHAGGFNGRAIAAGFCYGGPYAIIGPKRLGFAAGFSCHGSQMGSTSPSSRACRSRCVSSGATRTTSCRPELAEHTAPSRKSARMSNCTSSRASSTPTCPRQRQGLRPEDLRFLDAARVRDARRVARQARAARARRKPGLEFARHRGDLLPEPAVARVFVRALVPEHVDAQFGQFERRIEACRPAARRCFSACARNRRDQVRVRHRVQTVP